MVKPQLDLYHKLHTSIVPIKPNSKAFDMAAIRRRGYRSLADLKTRGIKPPDIASWWPAGVERNTALITSAHLLILDFDDADKYWNYWGEQPYFANTLTVKSPHGYHAYYVTQEPAPKNLVAAWEGVEIMTNGKCILCPPSRIGTSYYQRVGVITQPLQIKRAESIGIVERRKIEGIGEAALPSYRVLDTRVIQRIKQLLPLSVFFSTWLERPVVRSGDGYWLTTCPFHDDDKPSFWINDSGLGNCFRGDCQADRPMDLLNIYERLHCCSLASAIRELAAELGI